MKILLRAGARPSRLSLRQVEEVARLLPDVEFKPVKIATPGDRDKRTPLAGFEGGDFFTRDIEEALLGGRIDVAIHSAKDLEEDAPAVLTIAAMTKSISPYDCLVSRKGLTLESLGSGAIIGTSSGKRRSEVARYRGDLIARDIRGDIDERLGQLDEGLYDAIIVAHAALIRLGYENRIAQIIPPDIVEPHPLQGRLAIQVRKDRPDLIDIFRGIDEN